MATKNLDAYKLGVVLDASGATKGITALKDADRQATKLDGTLTKLSKGFKVGIADAFEKELKAAEKMAAGGRVSAIGNQLGSIVGQGLQQGLGSVFTASNLGKLIGTAIAPGVGSVVGSVVGSAVDAALEKISGPLMNKIQRGIELNEQLEQAQLHYTTFIGKEKEATAHLDKLRKLATDDGLNLSVLLSADQRLEEFNHDVKLSELELRAAADAAASFYGRLDSEGLNTFSNALGIIAEKGELSSKVLTKLYRMGVNAPKYLSQAMGMSEARVKKLIAQNRIRGDVAAQIIAEGVEVERGGYAQRVSNTTLTGMRARNEALSDSLAQRGTVQITKGVEDSYSLVNSLLASGVADKTVAFIDRAAGSLKNLIEAAVKTGYSATSGLIEGMLDTSNLAAGIGNFVGKFTDVLKSTTGFDINSPSKKMIPVGESAAEGVVFGFENYLANEGGRRLSAAINATVAQARNEANMRRLFAREPDFLPKLKAMAAQRGINPDHLLNLMALETAGSFNPAVTNPFGYTGLIQFGKSAARDLGTSTAALRGMSATAQLDYVFRYLDQHAHDSAGRRVSLDTQAKLYAAVGAGHAERDDSSVFFRRGSAGFANNPAWNVNGDGLIQQWELGAAALSKLGAGVRFTVGDQSLSGANPMPVIMAGDLKGSPGVFINPATRAQDSYAQTLKDAVPVVVDITEKQQLLDTQLDRSTLATSVFLQPLEAVPGVLDSATRAQYSYSQSVEQFRKAAIRSGDTLTSIAGALGQISGMIPSQKVGRKRSFFSKLLGIAAPFVSLIPGVGPILGGILSQSLGIASSAVGGDWGGVVSKLSSGLASGGAFRPNSSTGNPSLGDVSTPHTDDPTRRATGGPIRRGRAYILNELRPEPIVFGDDAYVHPSMDSYLRSASGGPYRGDSGAVARLAEAVAMLHGKLSSMSPGHVLTAGATERPHVITETFISHASRDARALEWFNRRLAA